MEIVDAQVHLWGANTPEHPWPEKHTGSKPHRPYPFGGDELLPEMDAAGVSRAIAIPVTWAGNHNLAGLEAARKYPRRIAVMGFLDLGSPKPESESKSMGRLATWRDQPGMLGLRINISRRHRPAFVEGRLEWVFAEAEQAGVPVMFRSQHSDLHLMHGIASRHPRLRLVLDHLGLSKGDDPFGGFDEVIKLGPLANLGVKLSGLPPFASDAWPYRSLHPHIRRIYEAFGPRRMFWGTNMTKLPCSYRQAVTMFTEEMPWLSDDDKQWIMGRALLEWLGWK